MNRPPFSLRLMLLALLLIMSSAAPALSDQTRRATVSVEVDQKGALKLTLSLNFTPQDAPALQQNLKDSFGLTFQEVKTYDRESIKKARAAADSTEYSEEDYAGEDEEGSDWWFLTAHKDNALENHVLRMAGNLDLSLLTSELRRQGTEKVYFMFVLPAKAVFNNGASALMQCTPMADFQYCTHIADGAQDAPRVEFYLGYSSKDLWRALVSLFIFLLAPIVLVLWKRRQVLSRAGEDAAAVWFPYFRFLNRLMVCVWLVWMPVFSWTGGGEILRYAGTSGGRSMGLLSLLFEALSLALWFVPPAAVAILCYLLSHKVFARVRGMEWSPSEVFRQALWTQAAAILPFFFISLGLVSLASRNLTLTSLSLLAAFFGWLICARLAARAQGLDTLHAVMTGELRDRVFELAQRAGVRLQQLYVLPAEKSRMANAFARRDDAILVTDSILRHLNKREVDAIVAHEIAHIKEKHPRNLAVAFVATLLCVNFVAPSVGIALGLTSWMPLMFSLGVGLAVLVTYTLSRGYERHADAVAITLTNDAEALITGLAKLTRLNLMPLHQGVWDERLSTHPSTARRVEHLAGYSGITHERLRELLAAPETASERYSFSTAVENEKLFSTTFKARTMFRAGWTLIATIILTPIAVALLVRGFALGGALALAVYAGGYIAAFALYLLARNVASVLNYRHLPRRMSEKLARDGIRTDELAGICVGFAPEANPRIYEKHFVWDMGFLFLTEDRLCYVGEETRFALRRDEILSVSVGQGPPDFLPRRNVYVNWRMSESGASGTFNLAPAKAGYAWGRSGPTREIYNRLQAWLRFEQEAPAAQDALSNLTGPSYGSVTSLTPQQAVQKNVIINSILIIALIAFCLSVASRLSPLAILYVQSVTLFMCLLEQIPRLRYRDHAPEAQTLQSGQAEDETYKPGSWADNEA